jgi:predicted GNAT family N-acyltransferase
MRDLDLDRYRIERVPAELTYPLRVQVLRPGQPSRVVLSGDEDPMTGSFAALTTDGDVVGTAIVRPEPCPWRPEQAGAWRLRGMATAEELRGRGIGALVLRAAIAHVVLEGGQLIWCNARAAARTFYERAGFLVEGDEYIDPEIGPHVTMSRPVHLPID